MYVEPINDIAPVHFGNIANVLDWDDENAMIYQLLPDLYYLLVIAFVISQVSIKISKWICSR